MAWLAVRVAASLLIALPVTGAARTDHSTICQLCGMNSAKSQTEFILYLDDNTPPLHACCLNCARRLMKKLGTEVKQVTALDYRTRKHVPAKEAFYVLGSKRIPQGSMMPFVFAFGSRKDAEAFKDRYGGEVLAFTEIICQLEAEQKSK